MKKDTAAVRAEILEKDFVEAMISNAEVLYVYCNTTH
jgi:hypothetical protein